jgi:dTDP-4-amino-4,6-dideoxygalactose transaminase
MITTNNKALYEKLILYRTHGISKDPNLMTENHGGWYYQMLELGYNYRLTDMQAALGITQLKRADEGLEKRKTIANKYTEAFKSISDKLECPKYEEGHAFHLYVVKVKNGKRLDLYNHLRTKNIFAQVHYIPVHTMPYYQKLGYKKGGLPVAENYYDECLSLPMYPALSNDEQNYVIETILNFFK